MGWSLGYLPVRERQYIDDYLLAVGKALYVASCYEKKCLWVLRIAKLADQYESNPDLDAFQQFAQALKDKQLGSTLRDLGARTGYREEDMATLEKGRLARNYIAHEAAALGHLSSIGVAQLDAACAKLDQCVEDLAQADNLVSRSVYEIEEKEPAPAFIQTEYAKRVHDWVFTTLGGA